MWISVYPAGYERDPHMLGYVYSDYSLVQSTASFHFLSKFYQSCPFNKTSSHIDFPDKRSFKIKCSKGAYHENLYSLH